MSGLDYYSTIDEIRMLSSYMDLSHNNFMRIRKTIETELNENVQLYKNKKNLPAGTAVDQIIGEALRIGMNILEPPKNEDEQLSLNISYQLHWRESVGDFETTFYATVVIMVYSIIERGLKRIFDLDDSLCGEKVAQKVRTILNAQPNKKIDDAVWKEVKLIRMLRNRIVHSGMMFHIDDSRSAPPYMVDRDETYSKIASDLMDYLKSNTIYTIVIQPYGAITLNYDYCKYLVKFTQDFFNQLNSFL